MLQSAAAAAAAAAIMGCCRRFWMGMSNPVRVGPLLGSWWKQASDTPNRWPRAPIQE